MLFAVRFQVVAGNDNNGAPAFHVNPITGVFTLASQLLYATSPRSITVTVLISDDNTAGNPVGTIGRTTVNITANVGHCTPSRCVQFMLTCSYNFALPLGVLIYVWVCLCACMRAISLDRLC